MNIKGAAKNFAKGEGFVLAGVAPVVWVSWLLLAIVVGWAFHTCGKRSDNAPKIPPAVQKTIDSLNRTNDSVHKATDSVLTVVKHDTVHAIKILRRVDTVERIIRRTEAAADSLAKLQQWEAAYRAEKVANDSLHVVNDSLHAAFVAERNARVETFRLFVSDTVRRTTIERVNTDLQKAISKLQQPCKVIGPIPCPSRTATAVISSLTGLTVGLLVPKR